MNSVSTVKLEGTVFYFGFVFLPQRALCYDKKALNEKEVLRS